MRIHEYAQGRKRCNAYQPSATSTLIILIPVLFPSTWRCDVLHRLFTITVRSTALRLAHLFLLLSSPPLRRRGPVSILITVIYSIGSSLLALAPRGRLFVLAWLVDWNFATGGWVGNPFNELLEKIEHFSRLDCVLSGTRMGTEC